MAATDGTRQELILTENTQSAEPAPLEAALGAGRPAPALPPPGPSLTLESSDAGGVADLRTNSGRTAAGRPECGSAADRSRHLCFSRPRQLPRALPFSHIVSFLRSLKQVVRTCALYKGWGSRSAWTCFQARPARCLGFISPRWRGMSRLQCL